MEIWHRVVFRQDEISQDFVDFLKKNNAKIDLTNSILGVAYICEKPEMREAFFEFLQRKYTSSSTEARFTQREFNQAEWLSIRPKFRFEYPQPEDDPSYKSITYDDRNYCNECGSGLIQRDSFRVKREPKWGTRHFFMLNWVHDELFVDSIAKNILVENGIQGMKYPDVLHYKKGTSFTNLYQIYVENTLPPGLTNLQQSVRESLFCDRCKKTKYIYSGRGVTYKKELFENLNLDIIKSDEAFGGGRLYIKDIIISQRLYQILKTNKLNRDVCFEPITLE